MHKRHHNQGPTVMCTYSHSKNQPLNCG